MSERDRIRWHCRRGLLELDIVLGRFVQRHLDALDARDLAAFRKLLDEPDNELLDVVMGRAEYNDPECGAVLALLRQN